MVIDNSRNPEPSFEVADAENYRGEGDLTFNHQTLVMEILRKVSECGSHELRPGWFNEKVDNNGNITRMYIEDTRKKFVETIRSAMSIMQCDYDTEAEENIGGWFEELEDEKEKLLKAQWDWYQKLPPRPKSQLAGQINQLFFNTNLGWYMKYLELSVECYRAIATELHELTKRLDFYQSGEYEAN